MKPRKLMDYIELAAGHLEAHGIDSPRLDAEVLLAHVLDVDRMTLYVQFDRPLNNDEVTRYRQKIARRARREPVAYITGKREFYSIPLKIDSRALIPRADTEILVDEVVRLLENVFSDDDRIDVADVGTGSGAIAIAVASSDHRVHVLASDIDADALSLARENVTLTDLADRVTLVQGNLLEPLRGRKFHAVVSNPPYIADGDWDYLSTDIQHYEPKIALLGGEEGLDYTVQLIRTSREFLHPDGFLALEIGYSHGERIRSIAKEAGFEKSFIRRDLAGHDRVVVMGNRLG